MTTQTILQLEGKEKMARIRDQHSEEVPEDLRVLREIQELSESLDLDDVQDILDSPWYQVQGLSFLLVSGGRVKEKFTRELEEVGVSLQIFVRPIIRVSEGQKMFGWTRGFWIKED